MPLIAFRIFYKWNISLIILFFTFRIPFHPFHKKPNLSKVFVLNLNMKLFALLFASAFTVLVASSPLVPEPIKTGECGAWCVTNLDCWHCGFWCANARPTTGQVCNPPPLSSPII